ncbi:hypothetical protein SAMN05444166_8279 [Singulisphaera sp. GP187]|nr:hypothetical protein SAMN05444166_8279 [Singulisphaera sp. GP187]
MQSLEPSNIARGSDYALGLAGHQGRAVGYGLKDPHLLL